MAIVNLGIFILLKLILLVYILNNIEVDQLTWNANGGGVVVPSTVSAADASCGGAKQEAVHALALVRQLSARPILVVDVRERNFPRHEGGKRGRVRASFEMVKSLYCNVLSITLRICLYD